MSDVIAVALAVAFFALCAAYVRWCDRIIGPDSDDLDDLAELDARADDLEPAEQPVAP